MSNVCRTAIAREHSRERMTITAANQPLRGGQQAQAFQVAKLASTSAFVLQPLTSIRRPKKQPETEEPKRKESNQEASASRQQSFSAAERKNTPGLSCCSASDGISNACRTASAKDACEVFLRATCAATRKNTKCVSRRRLQPKNLPQKTQAANNKDASSTTAILSAPLSGRSPDLFTQREQRHVGCLQNNEWTRQVSTTHAHKIAAIAKLVSTSGFVLQPSTSGVGLRPPASGLGFRSPPSDPQAI